MTTSVEEAVRDITVEGLERFHGSYVAKRTDIPQDAVNEALAHLVEVGRLDVRLEVLCPTCARTLKVFRSGDSVPIGQLMDAHDACDQEAFVLEERDLWVAYEPTSRYKSRLFKDQPPPRPPKKVRRGNR
jgi:hypothetical protein